MFKDIHRKPKPIREQYAFWSAAGITALIALVWIVSLQYRLDGSFTSSTIVEGEQRGAFARFLGDARSRAAAVFGAVEDTETTATTTDAAGSAATSTPRPAFEFVPGERETATNSPATTHATATPRTVRIRPVSNAATGTTAE